MNPLKHIALTWKQYRAFQAALAAYDHMSDRQLAEAGLARGDVIRLAFEEAERRVAMPADLSRRAPDAPDGGAALPAAAR